MRRFFPTSNAPITPLPLTLIRWGALLSAGRTFGTDVRRVEKACALLGLVRGWRTPPVEAAISGLSNPRVSRQRCDDILSYPDFEMFARHGSARSEFGVIRFADSLSIFRLESESLPIKRAYPNDPFLPTQSD